MIMNVNQIVAQKLIERLKTAEETGEKFYWIKPFAKNCPRTAMSYDSSLEYRGINRILLDSSKEYLTYKKIMEINGQNPNDFYRLRKGSRGNIVVYFNKVPVKDEETGEPKIDEKTGLPVMKSFARYYTVFDREDVINKDDVNLPSKFPIEQYDHSDEEEQLQLALLKFSAIVKSYCNRYNITIEETYQGTEAYFMPSTNTIRIPSKETFKTITSFCETMFHELVHSTMLELGRNKTDKGMTIYDSMKSYSVEELIAELGAAMLMASLNLPNQETEKNSLGYLQGWSKFLSEKQASLIYAASQAEKAVELIVSEFEHNLEHMQGNELNEQENRSDDLTEDAER